jgi:hypothetical protein
LLHGTVISMRPLQGRRHHRAPADRPGADPRGEQLTPAHHAMLSPRERRDHAVGAKVENFAPYAVVNFSTSAHAPDDAGETATELASSMPILTFHSPKTLMTSRLSRPPSNSA